MNLKNMYTNNCIMSRRTSTNSGKGLNDTGKGQFIVISDSIWYQLSGGKHTAQLSLTSEDSEQNFWVKFGTLHQKLQWYVFSFERRSFMTLVWIKLMARLSSMASCRIRQTSTGVLMCMNHRHHASTSSANCINSMVQVHLWCWIDMQHRLNRGAFLSIRY